MARRPSQQAFRPSPVSHQSAVSRYAERKGWNLGRRNLLVEGTSDVSYFELASRLHEEARGVPLVDQQFRIVAAGIGNAGGVRGVVNEFMKLYGLMQLDLDLPKKQRFRILPIFDDDYAGRRYFDAVTNQALPFTPFVHVFLLKRSYPKLPLGSPNYRDHLETANATWQELDCQIEDLLSRDLLDTFRDEHTDAFRRAPILVEGAHHYEINGHAKARLVRFAQNYATLDDVAGVVSVLSYFRGLFGLPPAICP